MIPDVRDYDFSALASEFDGIDVVIGVARRVKDFQMQIDRRIIL